MKRLAIRLACLAAATAGALLTFGSPAQANYGYGYPGYNAGFFNGNAVSNVIQTPINTCGNSVAILGISNAGCYGGGAYAANNVGNVYGNGYGYAPLYGRGFYGHRAYYARGFGYRPYYARAYGYRPFYGHRGVYTRTFYTNGCGGGYYARAYECGEKASKAGKAGKALKAGKAHNRVVYARSKHH